MTFPEKLILLRRGRGMTQTELAKELGVTRQSVYKWERGIAYPEAMTLFAMKQFFGISVDALLDSAVEISLPQKLSPIVTMSEEVATGQTAVNVSAEPQNTMSEPPKTEESETKDTVEPAPVQDTEKKKKRGFFSRLFR